MSDTATVESVLGPIGYVIEQTFGRKKRRDIWTTWGSLWSMLPKGGNKLWSIGADMCSTEDRSNEDDPFCPSDKSILSPMIQVTASDKSMQEKGACGEDGENDVCEPISQAVAAFRENDAHLSTDIINFLNAHGGGLGPGIASAKFHSQYGEESSSPRTWHDPSKEALPYAPNMKLYCMYGTGKQTERGYYYKRNHEGDQDPTIIIDSSVNDNKTKSEYGIRYSDGDGSVNLLSLGYLCVDAWKRNETGLNPSNMSVYTVSKITSLHKITK